MPTGGIGGAPVVASRDTIRSQNGGVNSTVTAAPDTAVQSPLQRIRAALREDAGLPALGQAVSTVSRMASGDSDTVDQLAQAILSDMSLTQRLLRCANSPLYRTRDAAPVSTVSRALMLLGFDQIRTLALSMMLVDRLVSQDGAAQVMRDFGQSLRAASVSRCLLQRRWPAYAEEAAIAAMFRNIGRIVAAVHVPDTMAAVRAAIQEGQPESVVTKRLIGRTFDELTLEVVGGWGLPPRLEQMLQPMPTRIASPNGSLDWVRLAAAFGDEAAVLHRRFGVAGRDRTAAALARRFGDATDLSDADIVEVLIQSERETALLAQALGLSAAVADPMTIRPAAAPQGAAGEDASEASAAPTPVSGPPAAGESSERRLLSTLFQMSEALTQPQGSHRVVNLATEALREALDATHAAYFARDDAIGAYRPWAATGCDLAMLRARITMPLQYAPDLFHAAIGRSADLHIADLTVETVRTRLPAWLQVVFPQIRGFLLLPVVIDGRPMGFFYAGRDTAGAPPPDARQKEAIRLLRNQVVLALKTDTARG